MGDYKFEEFKKECCRRLYHPISNETDDVLCCEPLNLCPIDKNMYIVAYLSSIGIPNCGLYFKVIKFDDKVANVFGYGMPLQLCRISMENPNYITGFDETFKLNEIQKIKLVKVLSSYYGPSGKTTWEYIFHVLNHNVHQCYEIDPAPHIPVFVPTDMPDYLKL